MINDNRQKNFNNRGFNLPYIPYPAYRSNSTPSTPKSEAAESEDTVTEQAAAPISADLAQPEAVPAAPDTAGAGEPPAAFATAAGEAAISAAESARPDAPPEAAPMTSVDESADSCPPESSVTTNAGESGLVSAGENDDSNNEETVFAAEASGHEILTAEEVDIRIDEVHNAEPPEAVHTAENTGPEPEASAAPAAEPAAPESMAMEADAGESIQSTAIEAPHKKEGKVRRNFFHEGPAKMPPTDGLYGRGLFHYQEWWFRNQIDICVNGKLISGIPIFADHNTIRVVNEKHSYFIPVEKIDYIRTPDGLDP